jgi:hypothetical protein
MPIELPQDISTIPGSVTPDRPVPKPAPAGLPLIAGWWALLRQVQLARTASRSIHVQTHWSFARRRSKLSVCAMGNQHAQMLWFART